VLGSIPVVLGIPVPGDCYDFEELEDGERSVDHDFGSRASAIPSDDVVSVGPGIDETDPVAHAGNVRLVKRGAGSLVLTAANSHTGGTTVEDGTLVVRHAAALGSGGLVIRATASVACDLTVEIAIGSLALDAGASLDVGSGRIRVASGGYVMADLMGLLIAGHAGGWSAGPGVVSRTAAATAARGVGYTVNDDGSLTVAFSAPGDTNLDGTIDLLDASNFVAAATYDAAVTAEWARGDFNYDGFVDLLDAAEFIGAGLFDGGSYLPVAAVAAATAASSPPPTPLEIAFAAFLPADAPRKLRSRYPPAP